MQEFSEVKTGTMSLISLDNDQHLFCLLLLEVSVSYLHVKSSTATKISNFADFLSRSWFYHI